MSGSLVTVTGWTVFTGGPVVTRAGKAAEFAMTVTGPTTMGMFNNAAMGRDTVGRKSGKNTINYNLVPAHKPVFRGFKTRKTGLLFQAIACYCEGVPSYDQLMSGFAGSPILVPF